MFYVLLEEDEIISHPFIRISRNQDEPVPPPLPPLEFCGRRPLVLLGLEVLARVYDR